jgi:poly-gamma-glutamate capsule biosynthesis protein CapA/YwtB (metallophosphatase superfamily)
MAWRGLLVVVALGLALGAGFWLVKDSDPAPQISAPLSLQTHVSLLAVGDVNLGRRVGQILLAGDTLYPWEAVRDSFARYDIVFANLESNLSDQNGRTVDPTSNVVFTGPPMGARSLALAGVTIVSTANNHAMDFGVRALQETARYLDDARVQHVGTSGTGKDLFRPVEVRAHGMVFAFLACTDLMNGEGTAWRNYVVPADTERLFPAIRNARKSADMVIVSFHGGEEYAERPSSRVVEFARGVIRAGADVFLGHHPHVPYGIEKLDKGYIVHSLGNFVFMQPGKFWTVHSYAVALDCVRDTSGARIASLRCLPVACGFQPRFLGNGSEADSVMQRVRGLSSMDRDLMEQRTW